MPSRSGVWKFSVDRDKITDEERVQAFARVESSQAKYDLTVTCGKRGAELVIATFEPLGTDAKRIPWSFYGPQPDRRIRLRIDLNPALVPSLEMRGYVNQGQVRPGDISAQFKNLVLALGWLGRLRCRDHGHTNAAGIVEHVTGADGRDDFAKLDPAEFPDARNQLELLDRLFPRKTTVGAPNQRQRFVELFPALAQALVQTPA